MKFCYFLLALTMFLKPIVPVVEYVVNYDYISKVLCENKEKPELKCNGKCHLMKEMAKQAESEKPISTDKKNTSNQETEVLFFTKLDSFNLAISFGRNKSTININYLENYNFLNSVFIFHPPIFV